MQITYDEETDVLAINLADGEYDHSEDIERDVVIAHFDAQNRLIGLELLDARDRLGPDPLSRVSIERYAAKATAESLHGRV